MMGLKGRNTTGMTSIGETLRRERLKRNLELAQIAQELKISARFLEAIEAGQLDKLPGGVFTRSFIVQYARLLGLDGDKIAGELQRTLDPPPEVPEFVESGQTGGFRDSRAASRGVGDGWQGRFRWSSSLSSAAALVVVNAGVLGFVMLVAAHAPSAARAMKGPPVAAAQSSATAAAVEQPRRPADQPSTTPAGTQPPSETPPLLRRSSQRLPRRGRPQPPVAVAGASAPHPNPAQPPTAVAGASAPIRTRRSRPPPWPPLPHPIRTGAAARCRAAAGRCAWKLTADEPV